MGSPCRLVLPPHPCSIPAWCQQSSAYATMPAASRAMSGSSVLSASCTYFKAETAEIIWAISDLTLLSWETQKVSPLSLAGRDWAVVAMHIWPLQANSDSTSLQEKGQQLEQLQKPLTLPSNCFLLHTPPQHDSLVRTSLGTEIPGFPEAKNSLWSKRDGTRSLSLIEKLGLG